MNDHRPIAAGDLKPWQTQIHPEILKELKKSAIDAEQKPAERLHDLLCGAFDRPDLLLQAHTAGAVR